MLFTAFMLGFVGSLHCAAMCGPLVLAMPVVGNTRLQLLASRLVYNLGRIATYSLLGLLFGLIGKSLLLAGFQQWLSITAGVAILAFLVFQRKGFNGGWRAAIWIKATFRNLLQKRTFPAILLLGAANGFLPCGLVYIAGTASAATGRLTEAALYMFVFGLGTLPMMLGMSLFRGVFARHLQRLQLRRLVPVAVSLVALSLILRGLALGIPYLSPAVANGSVVCSACVQR